MINVVHFARQWLVYIGNLTKLLSAIKQNPSLEKDDLSVSSPKNRQGTRLVGVTSPLTVNSL